MGHQAQNVSRPIANAGNVIARAVWISLGGNVSIPVAVTKDNPIFALKFPERRIVANEVSLGMGDRKS
jgi:hypothetical protein